MLSFEEKEPEPAVLAPALAPATSSLGLSSRKLGPEMRPPATPQSSYGQPPGPATEKPKPSPNQILADSPTEKPEPSPNQIPADSPAEKPEPIPNQILATMEKLEPLPTNENPAGPAAPTPEPLQSEGGVAANEQEPVLSPTHGSDSDVFDAEPGIVRGDQQAFKDEQKAKRSEQEGSKNAGGRGRGRGRGGKGRGQKKDHVMKRPAAKPAKKPAAAPPANEAAEDDEQPDPQPAEELEEKSEMADLPQPQVGKRKQSMTGSEPKTKEPKKPRKQQGSAKNEKQTFARRYLPETEDGAAKWKGLRRAFEAGVAPKLWRPSKFEDTSTETPHSQRLET